MYRPAIVQAKTGKLLPEIAEIAKGDRRMTMNPITNAGVIKPMDTADWRACLLQEIETPGFHHGFKI